MDGKRAVKKSSIGADTGGYYFYEKMARIRDKRMFSVSRHRDNPIMLTIFI